MANNAMWSSFKMIIADHLLMREKWKYLHYVHHKLKTISRSAVTSPCHRVELFTTHYSPHGSLVSGSSGVVSVEVWPGCGEPGGVVASVNERGEDGQNKQADLRILHQREGQQRLQERRGQRRQQVATFVMLWHLRHRGGTASMSDWQENVI